MYSVFCFYSICVVGLGTNLHEHACDMRFHIDMSPVVSTLHVHVHTEVLIRLYIANFTDAIEPMATLARVGQGSRPGTIAYRGRHKRLFTQIRKRECMRTCNAKHTAAFSA